MRNAVQPLLVMSRVFDAPREEVFTEWCDPARLARWWEMRRDGRRRPDLDRYSVSICAVVAPERIVFLWGGRHADTTTLITIVFVEDGARTRWKLEQSIARSPWWCAALDRLDEVLDRSQHPGVLA